MRGLTRRLRREWWGCRPEGVVLSFEAKESTKESTRHGDYVKKASTAHFAGGARNVARNGVGQLSPTPVRAPVLAFFRRQNGWVAYRRSAPPQLALGRLSQRELGYYAAAWVASLHRETGLIFFPLRLALCLLNQRRLACFGAN